MGISQVNNKEKMRSQQFIIKVNSIENINLLPIKNKILVKILSINEGSKTKSGVYISHDPADNEPGYNEAQNSDRYGEVVKLPKRLYYNRKSSDSMPWKTDIELKIGDIVWFDYLDSLNCDIIQCGNEEYKLISYNSCYVAKRGDNIICLNGFILSERIKKEKESILEYDEDCIDKRYGIIKHIGKCNQEYKNKYYDEDIFNIGDKVAFRMPLAEVLLEDKLFSKFDGENLYRVSQRKDLLGKYK